MRAGEEIEHDEDEVGDAEVKCECTCKHELEDDVSAADLSGNNDVVTNEGEGEEDPATLLPVIAGCNVAGDWYPVSWAVLGKTASPDWCGSLRVTGSTEVCE